jgi:hypothetical protein
LPLKAEMCGALGHVLLRARSIPDSDYKSAIFKCFTDYILAA